MLNEPFHEGLTLLIKFTSKIKDIKMKVQRLKLMRNSKLKDHSLKIDKILGLVHHWKRCRSFAVVPSVAYTRQNR